MSSCKGARPRRCGGGWWYGVWQRSRWTAMNSPPQKYKETHLLNTQSWDGWWGKIKQKLEKEDDALRVKELWSNDRANKILLAKWSCLHRQKLLVVLNSFLSWLTQTPPKQSCFDVDKQKSAKLAGYVVKLPEAYLTKVSACRLYKFECFPNKILLTSLLVPSNGIVVKSGEPCFLFKFEFS